MCYQHQHANAELNDRRKQPENMNEETKQACPYNLHILGPDDIIPHATELDALREANALNLAMAEERRKHANDPHYPWSMAVVEARAGDRQTEAAPNAGNIAGSISAIGSAKLEAITIARRGISDAFVEQTMGLRDDVNEVVERILSELYEAGRTSSPNGGS